MQAGPLQEVLGEPGRVFSLVVVGVVLLIVSAQKLQQTHHVLAGKGMGLLKKYIGIFCVRENIDC